MPWAVCWEVRGEWCLTIHWQIGGLGEEREGRESGRGMHDVHSEKSAMYSSAQSSLQAAGKNPALPSSNRRFCCAEEDELGQRRGRG